MPRYIDADELPKVKYHALPYTHIVPSDLKGLQTEAYERGWNDAIDAIVENAETADVVEVIRCRECKHYQFANERAFGMPVKRCEITGFEDVDDDDFCSRGERRDDAGIHH